MSDLFQGSDPLAPSGPYADGHPPVGAPRSARQRTHPITPLVNAAQGLLAVLFAAVLVFGGSVRALAGGLGWPLALLIVMLGLLALFALVAGFSYVSWRRTEYFFDVEGDFRVDSGVLSRKERRIALSRLQSVDVLRPLLGRVLGLAQLRIEVAGSKQAHVLLGYLTESQAVALRAEVLARAAGVHPAAGEAPEVVVATVPATDLLMSLVLRTETIVLFLVSVLIVVVTTLSEGTGGLVLLVFTGGLPLLNVFGEYLRSFNFTVAESPDGLRLRFGLLRTESQTVPPGRVQAVEFEEPLLWRHRGWVRVRLNVAGSGTGGNEEAKLERILLPVAPYPVAREIVSRALPGVDPLAVALIPAGGRARWRAWLQWSQLGVAADDQVFITRRGFLTRRTAVVPHARTQSVRVTQGPWQRQLGLASMHLDSTPGPVKISALHRRAAEARDLAEAQLLRAAAARRTGPPQRWLAGDAR